MPKILTFKSVEDAQAVASQLYDCELKDNMIMIADESYLAADLAIALGGIDLERVEGLSCLLPFPSGERECINLNEIRIYVRCLSAYAHGIFHGMWIKACREPDEIKSDIKWLLLWSPVAHLETCEEWAIHDYEGFEGLRLDEYESIERVSAIAQSINEHGKAFAIYCKYYADNSRFEGFKDKYCGVYESEEAFVREQWEEDGTLAQLEKIIQFTDSYVNWSAVAHDWSINSYLMIEASHNEVYVFHRQ